MTRTKKESQVQKIQRLEQEISNMREEIERLRTENETVYQRLYAMQNNAENLIVESPQYKQIKKENEVLLSQKLILEKRVSRLEKTTHKHIHNERGAGRKPTDTTKRYRDFVSLMKDHKLKDEIMGELGISNSTYYRYLKIYNLNN